MALPASSSRPAERPQWPSSAACPDYTFSSSTLAGGCNTRDATPPVWADELVRAQVRPRSFRAPVRARSDPPTAVHVRATRPRSAKNVGDHPHPHRLLLYVYPPTHVPSMIPKQRSSSCVWCASSLKYRTSSELERERCWRANISPPENPSDTPTSDLVLGDGSFWSVYSLYYYVLVYYPDVLRLRTVVHLDRLMYIA
jgi:hypothetical protein